MTELLLTLPMAADAIVFERWRATVSPNLAKRKSERLKHASAAKLGWAKRRGWA